MAAPYVPIIHGKHLLALAPGTRIGAYEVTAQIGVGGMGEVYRARDVKLGRNVALKVLPDLFIADPDRLARFQREAETLAALNHPHIAAIHGLEDAGGVCALVLELVEGETLADRIAGGPIAIDEALPIARQIADALEAAHEQGIIHRDLKPANIKITPDGVVKVLDFGLAKVTGPNASNGSNARAGLSQSPTITSPAMMTGVGVILGTAAYMSPEQSKGRPADKRSDVWAFGCVLYEMLTGKRAFYGEDVADMLAAVLKSEPDWNALPSDVPPSVRALIQGCLRKDRKERIGDLSTARFALEHRHPEMQSDVIAQPSVWRRAVPVFAGVLLGAAVVAIASFRANPSVTREVTRFTDTLSEGQALSLNRQGVAISPDGTRLIYTAEGGLLLRSMADLKPRLIPGTDRAINPVFSPDGQSLVFWADSGLKKVPIGGGTAVTIAALDQAPSSIAWTNDHIFFSTSTGLVMRVSQNGGKPEVLFKSNSDEEVHGSQLLPDGRTMLFSIVKRARAGAPDRLNRWDDAHIVVQSLEGGTRKTLIEGGSDARYVPTGHVVYALGATLFAMRFDLAKLEVTGGAVPVVEGVRRGGAFGQTGKAHFAFSDTGSLAYIPGPLSQAGQQEVALFDRNGHAEPLKLPRGRYDSPRLSPDAKRLAFATNDGKEAVISIYELSGASSVRPLTLEGNNGYPVWSRDSQRVTFQSDRGGDVAIWWQAADGGLAERLTTPPAGASHTPESWSPVEDVLLFSETKDSVSSLWTLSLKDRKVTPFGGVNGSSLPTDATFSPDGQWVAYQIGQTGPGEGTTYVQPYPPRGLKIQIARGGRPLWSRDGTQLFFVPSTDSFMFVTVKTEPTFTFTTPAAIPRGFGVSAPSNPRTFDAMPDGRVVGVRVVQSDDGAPPAQIHVVLNWFEELKRLAPVR
jgi:serine/threonine protein kinase/Tol biopolymer transport system component